jgi:hypothetical protein
MAGLVTMDAYIRQTGDSLERWSETKAGHRPNLRGQMNYVDSPRHANYVEVGTYRRVISEAKAAYGWPDPTDAAYETLRVAEVPTLP